jgi:type IV pilus assembly protein PilC
MKSTKQFLGLFGPRIKGEELLLFTQELGAMLDAGIGLVRSLNVIAEDSESPILRQVVLDLAHGLGQGKQLSETLKKYENLFSRLYISMVEAGEASGNLPMILLKLAEHIERAETLKKKVQAALYYPAIVVSFAMCVVVFIFIFGIPVISKIYAGFESSLPIFTVLLIDTGNFLSKNWYFIFPILIVIVLAFLRFLKTDRGAQWFDNFKLVAPIIGPLFQKLAISRFAGTMSTLYTSGVPILQAMRIVATSSGNRVIENVVLETLKGLKEGQTIVDPLRKSGVFTNLAISMIAAGEESGTMGMMLEKVSRFYETQVDISLKALTGLIEPIIIIVIGFFIGVIILALALPFMNIASVMR